MPVFALEVENNNEQCKIQDTRKKNLQLFVVQLTCGLIFRDLLSSEEEVAPGMRLWRKSLGQVRSSAQLSLCIQQLQKSIAWERAIMKVVSVT